MRKIAILITMFTLLYCEIQFKPIIALSYLSTGSDFQSVNKEIKIFGAGLGAVYDSGNLYIAAEFINHRVYGVNDRNQLHTFNSNQGLSWGQSPGETKNSFDYDFADLDVRYETRNGELFFGKMNPQWGEGEAKLTFSNKAPSFPLFGFNWIVNENISMEYFHGQLMSGVEDENIKYFQNSDYTYDKKIFKSRNIAAHRIIWDVSDKLTINAMESVIYAIRGLDLHYMIPFIPFWSMQHYLGDTDNIQMAGELIYSPTKRLSLYGTIFMDEWAPDKTFDKDNRNWFGYQSGFLLKNSLIDHDRLRFEYTWTDNRIYRHKFIENDNYSHDYPMGFWAGPHAEELFFSYNVNIFDIDWAATISKAKRGKFTDLSDQYMTEEVKRFEGLVEEKVFLELEVTKPIYKEFFLTAGISYVDWKNAGFDPNGDDSQELEDIQKTSLNLSLNYNY